jgi:hypothetical protein
MKVKIKDLHPNPYRDMENYPINREKVETLIASIEHTGFWDNILARDKDGVIQIAYGHHRLTALQEALSPDDTVDIPVKNLPDHLMLKIMANENMEEFKTGPAIIDETVKVTKKFLEENPDQVKTKKPSRIKGVVSHEEPGYSTTPLAFQIAEFLGRGWKEKTVYYSLQRLNLVDEGKIDKSYTSIPSDTASRNFVSAVKKYNLPVEKQVDVIREIVDGENYGHDAIEEKVSRAKFPSTPKEKVKREEFEREMKGIQFNNYVNTVYNKTLDLDKHVDLLIDFKDQFNYLSFQDVKDASTRLSILASLKRLAGRINKLLNIIENENNSD